MTKIVQSLLIICCITLISSSISAREKYEEIQVKAGFITTFISFTRWPVEPRSRTSNFVICIAGEDPYSEIFEQFPISGIRGRPLQVKHLSEDLLLPSIRECHVLFVRLTDEPDINQLLDKVTDLPILTISEMKNYDQQHSMINLSNKDKKLVFTINRQLSNHVGIEFSSGMLRLAEKIVGGEG